MTIKDRVINDVLVAMRVHVTSQTIAILSGIMAQVMYGIDMIEEKTSLATIDNTNEYIIQLFMVKKAPKLSENTVDQYMIHINNLIDMSSKPLILIKKDDVERYLYQYKKRGNSNVSVNNCKRCLSAFFTWMRREDLIIKNPVENIDNYKESVKQIEHLEAEQWEQLKTGCNKTKDRALLEFLRCTAMRDGEVPAVRVCDVDWSDGKIIIFGQKSDRYRTVCIDRVARDYLNRYLQERGITQSSKEPLFISNGSVNPLQRCGIYSAIKAIARRAGMDINVYPHLIRKTTATNIIKRGGSTEEAGEYLGHAESNTAGRHYAYKGEEHVYDIFRRRVAAI